MRADPGSLVVLCWGVLGNTMAAPPASPPSISEWQRAVLAIKQQGITQAVAGSCFVIDAHNGLLWTCSHVVGQAIGTVWQLGMATAPGQQITWLYDAEVVYSTPPQPAGLDGALLKIRARLPHFSSELHPLTQADGQPLCALPLGDDATLRLPGDEPAILIGYPGASQVVTPTVGIYANYNSGGDFLLTDSTMLPGHSGGPGLNHRGEVVGWNVRHAEVGVYSDSNLHVGGIHPTLKVACGINELRPVKMLLAELQGPAAAAAFGYDVPHDIRAYLAEQLGCIKPGTHAFGGAAASAFAQNANAHAEAAATSWAHAVAAAYDASAASALAEGHAGAAATSRMEATAAAIEAGCTNVLAAGHAGAAAGHAGAAAGHAGAAADAAGEIAAEMCDQLAAEKHEDARRAERQAQIWEAQAKRQRLGTDGVSSEGDGGGGGSGGGGSGGGGSGGRGSGGGGSGGGGGDGSSGGEGRGESDEGGGEYGGRSNGIEGEGSGGGDSGGDPRGSGGGGSAGSGNGQDHANADEPQRKRAKPNESVSSVPPLMVLFQSEPLTHKVGKKMQPVPALNLGAERRLLCAKLAEARRSLELQDRFASIDNLLTLLTAIHDSSRSVMLHYSGHGLPNELIFEDTKYLGQAHKVTNEKLGGMLRTGGMAPIQVVTVAACHSREAAHAFVGAGVPHVVGIKCESMLADEAAHAFTGHFYFALVNGRSVRQAFDIAKQAVLNRRALEEWHISEVEASKFLLLPEAASHDEILLPALDMCEAWSPPPSRHMISPAPPDHFVGRSLDIQRALDGLSPSSHLGCRLISIRVRSLPSLRPARVHSRRFVLPLCSAGCGRDR